LLNLARATEVRVEESSTVERVAYVLVATQDGKVVARLSGVLPIQGAGLPGAAQPPGQSGGFAPEMTTRKLPAPVEDVAVGGGGRYLILHLPKVRKLAIFDAQSAKVTRFLDFAEDSILFTAGLDKLLVVLPAAKVLERWDLHTGEREKRSPIPFKGVVKAICMGCASTRLLLMHGAVGTEPLDQSFFHFIDIRSLKAIDANPILGRGHYGCYRDLLHLRASPDGLVYGMWCTSHSPQGFQTIVVTDDQVKVFYEHTDVGFVVPGPDDKTIFTGHGLFKLDGKPKSPSGRQDPVALLPACQGNYYLSIAAGPGGRPAFQPPDPSRQPAERKAGVSVYLLGDFRPLLTLTDIPVVDVEPWIRHDFSADKRLHFLPEYKLLVAIPAAADELLLYHFDVLEALEKSGLDYLFVTSQPPATARRGATFAYQVEVKSKRGGLKYKLESGPRNLVVSPNGKISWQVPETAEAEVPVIVSVEDASGQECFHAFTLRIVD
jgi:hypothetical protein